jgi:hypothetical protein
MEIAGIAVNRLAVLGLAERLVHAGHMETAALLLIAHACGDERVGLSIKDQKPFSLSFAILPKVSASSVER